LQSFLVDVYDNHMVSLLSDWANFDLKMP